MTSLVPGSEFRVPGCSLHSLPFQGEINTAFIVRLREMHNEPPTFSRFRVSSCALIGIRASAGSATGQMISGTGPEAASKMANQGNYRGRNDSDCAAARKLPGD